MQSNVHCVFEKTVPMLFLQLDKTLAILNKCKRTTEISPTKSIIVSTANVTFVVTENLQQCILTLSSEDFDQKITRAQEPH